ncbi:phage portal protein [Comamonas thiooxydans]|uniref:phage portal protein n=1 Tax=Comamonas thiooxydans TaxID=363952 RepID=UPI00070F3C7F|nr:phage portal protein [Comamonas thiooxydans]
MFFSELLGRGQPVSTVSSSKGEVWQGILGGASMSSSGVRVTPESAMALPSLQTCITLLAESLASCSPDLFERQNDGGRIIASAHPAHDVVRFDPNGHQTPYEYIEHNQLCAGLRGNSYSFIDRRDDGNIAKLWPLDVSKVTVLKGPDQLPYYRVAGYDGVLPMRLVHHVRWHSHNGYTGLSPIELHADTIGLADAVRRFTGKSFANGSTVAGVIERPKEVSAITDTASIKKITDQWGEKFQGIDNHAKVALLQEGMSFKPVSMTNVDAEIVEILKLTGADIPRIYKVPLPMAGYLDEAKYNTMEQMFMHFVVFGLLPWAKRTEQAMNRDFLIPADRRKYYFEFNLSGLMRGDQKSRYDAYAIGRQWGWLSVNDIRRLENLPPIAGGNIYLQPLNMVDAGKGKPDLTNPQTRAQLEDQREQITRLLAV